MPAIASISGFALRDQHAPPYGATWDVRADRQHSTSGWLFPRLPNPAAPLLTTPPTIPERTSRYASVSDIARVQPRAATQPWVGMSATSNSTLRVATPSSAVLLNTVSKKPPGFVTETSHRRMIEVNHGVPAFDGAAGRASAQLVRNRLVADPTTHPRSGYIFTTM